jgi:hypothetical protein
VSRLLSIFRPKTLQYGRFSALILFALFIYVLIYVVTDPILQVILFNFDKVGWAHSIEEIQNSVDGGISMPSGWTFTVAEIILNVLTPVVVWLLLFRDRLSISKFLLIFFGIKIFSYFFVFDVYRLLSTLQHQILVYFDAMGWLSLASQL